VYLEYFGMKAKPFSLSPDGSGGKLRLKQKRFYIVENLSLITPL